MFDYSLLHWTSFLSLAVVLNLAPGPDIAFILGHTARGGRSAGLAAMAGIWTGALGHVLLAAAGLSAILATSATAFAIVKWVGAAYLVWLGICALTSRGSHWKAADELPRLGRWSIFKQGVLVDLLNPKVAIFFLSILPQFVVPGAGPEWAQLLLHGILIIVVAALIDPLFVFAGAMLTRQFRDSPQLARWLDRVLGTMFIALGVKLATQRG